MSVLLPTVLGSWYGFPSPRYPLRSTDQILHVGLPRCHEQQGTAKPASCAASALKAVKPEPQAPEPAPLPAVARLCNLTAPSTPAQHRRTVRPRAFVPRYINGTFSHGVFANGTGPTLKTRSPETPVRAENTTYANHAPAPAPVQRRATLSAPYPFSNGTTSNTTTSTNIYARGLNITATSRAHGAILPRAASAPYLKTTLPRIQHESRATNTSAAGTVPFLNGTFSAAGVVGRKPPVVRRALREHLPLPVRFYA